MRKSHTVMDFYKFYLTQIERETVYDVEYKLYRQIVEDYFRYIVEQIMDNSREFKFPCRLGNLSIVKRQPKNFDNKSLRIDYHESKIQGKAVYFTNDHSNFFKFRFYWNKQSSLLTNKTKYQFIATRANKRRLAQIIKNKEHDYIEIK